MINDINPNQFNVTTPPPPEPIQIDNNEISEGIIIGNNSQSGNDINIDSEEALRILNEETLKYEEMSSNDIQTINHTKRGRNKKTGLEVIRVYSGENEDNYKEEKCFIFQSAPNEAKYKFQSGQQNAVDLIENGNNLHISVTKGMQELALDVQKNADGTYTIQNKTYASLDEIACDFNHYKLQPNYAEDGKVNATKQDMFTGDCSTLSALNALACTPEGKECIENCFTYNSDGTVTVKLQGFNTSVTLDRSTDKIWGKMNNAIGDAEPYYLEEALKIVLKDVRDGNIKLTSNAPYWCKKADNINNAIPIKALHSQQVLYALTGKECNTRALVGRDDATIQNYLDEFENHRGNAINVSTYKSPDGKKYNVNDTIKRKDAFGAPIVITTYHSYAIKDVSTRLNGERMITIINPDDSSKEIIMDEKTFLNTFEAFDSIQLKNNNNKPNYYST